MRNLPASAHEVKRIIEAVNLRTDDVDLYTIDDRGISEKPFNKVPRRFEDIVAKPGGRAFIGYGPDLKTILSGPPDLQPPYPEYTGDPFMYFERPEDFMNVPKELLSRLGVHSTPNGSPKENQREASLRSERPRKSKTDQPAARPEKAVSVPAPRQAAAPRHSVGRKLKLSFLPAELYESPSFEKLKFQEQEVYRILYTYCKLAGGKSLNSYISIGADQAAELLERRKKDMLGSRNPVSRKAAEKISTSYRSTRRHLQKLRKAGWIVCVLRGNPSESGNFVSKYLVVKSEKQWKKRWVEKKKKVVH